MPKFCCLVNRISVVLWSVILRDICYCGYKYNSPQHVYNTDIMSLYDSCCQPAPTFSHSFAYYFSAKVRAFSMDHIKTGTR